MRWTVCHKANLTSSGQKACLVSLFAGLFKPLFYAQEGETLYLASEPKAILAMGFKAEWDLEAVYDAFHALLPPQRTLFAGIHQVPPGHVLTYDERGLALREYWSALLHRAEGPQTLESAWGELERSVALRTRADVPIGCYLVTVRDSPSRQQPEGKSA